MKNNNIKWIYWWVDIVIAWHYFSFESLLTIIDKFQFLLSNFYIVYENIEKNLSFLYILSFFYKM